MSGRADTHASQRARQIASEFGLLNRHVFFVDEWVPYEDRGDWLLEADAAVIAAPPTLEAHFSVRIRSNDCIWAGTPIICTRGQPLADVVEQNQVGFVVEPHDVGGMREAIVMLADGDVRARMRERLARMRPEFSWTKVLQPLIAFCADPQPAGDRDPKTLSLTSRARLLTVMGLDNARLLVRRIACGFSFSG
jgi:glycosyltransferase involved in cell wall biosynthesis